MAAIILNCKCAHKSQDELHGVGRRVHNSMVVEGNSPQKWKCTVCKEERTAGAESTDTKKKKGKK